MNAMDTIPEPLPATPHRRRAWAFAGTAAAVLLLLALTPPYLNVNRLQRRIAASMSASLGRPVHLDNVTLHLLPLPGFTLENLVVSEDPDFGDEPVIRANSVEITLRLSSLWRRQVELSSIRFVEPSLNLVRNDQGRWNLQSLLNHAAAASQPAGAPFMRDASPAPGAPFLRGASPAPGAPFMRDASPAHERGTTNANTQPRFPYIEATDARVNVKLGAEKKPFSLTEADFALWLPDPSGWRVRLTGKPARTDQNITDPGILKLEGSLHRADAMAQVPVDLTASWEGAPLGQASRLLAGDDANWRGKLTVNATLNGPLGTAHLTLRIHIEELRRADFVPARTLDLLADCSGTADITSAVVTAPACKLTSQSSPYMLVTAVADTADLSRLTLPEGVTALRIGSAAVPESFLLDAARLFSQRIPTTVTANGKLTGSLALAPQPNAPPFWQGSLVANVGQLPGLPAARTTTPHPDLLLTGTPAGLVLEPIDLLPAGSTPPLLLNGIVTTTGTTLHLTGSATPAELTTLTQSLPPLADGLSQALPELTAAPTRPIHLDLTCTRPWRGPQTCTQTLPAPPTKKKHRR